MVSAFKHSCSKATSKLTIKTMLASGHSKGSNWDNFSFLRRFRFHFSVKFHVRGRSALWTLKIMQLMESNVGVTVFFRASQFTTQSILYFLTGIVFSGGPGCVLFYFSKNEKRNFCLLLCSCFHLLKTNIETFDTNLEVSVCLWKFFFRTTDVIHHSRNKCPFQVSYYFLKKFPFLHC